MQGRTFSGSDPIMVLQFMAHLTKCFVRIDITEAQAYLMLKNHLRNPTLTSFQNYQQPSRARHGIYNWPTAVDWLIRVYATETNIEQALSAPRSIKQKPEDKKWKAIISA